MKKGFTSVELIVVITILTIIGTIAFTALEGVSERAQEKTENDIVAETQKKLKKAVELPTLSNSLERLNIKKRLELFEDENNVSYIYFTSYGKIMAFYSVKGKISSSGKRLISNQKTEFINGYASYGALNKEAPGLDGTYGSSDSYIYFWTTEGVYVQWNGEYMMSDAPLKLSQNPVLIKEIK